MTPHAYRPECLPRDQGARPAHLCSRVGKALTQSRSATTWRYATYGRLSTKNLYILVREGVL